MIRIICDTDDDDLQALETYKAVHRRFPDNVECLKFLVRLLSLTRNHDYTKIYKIFNTQVKLCSDMGLKEAGEFALELKKAERAKEVIIIIVTIKSSSSLSWNYHYHHNVISSNSDHQVAEQRAVSSRPGSRRSSSRFLKFSCFFFYIFYSSRFLNPSILFLFLFFYIIHCRASLASRGGSAVSHGARWFNHQRRWWCWGWWRRWPQPCWRWYAQRPWECQEQTRRGGGGRGRVQTTGFRENHRSSWSSAWSSWPLSSYSSSSWIFTREQLAPPIHGSWLSPSPPPSWPSSSSSSSPFNG